METHRYNTDNEVPCLLRIDDPRNTKKKRSPSKADEASLPWAHERKYVAKRLMTDESYVFFALELLYEAQTSYEKTTRTTVKRNGQGFDIGDAPRFTRVAKAAIERGFLTTDELALCRKLDKRGVPVLAKYWRQILASRNEELAMFKRPAITKGPVNDIWRATA